MVSLQESGLDRTDIIYTTIYIIPMVIALVGIVIVAATTIIVAISGLIKSGQLLITLPVSQILVHTRRQITATANRIALDIVDKLLLVVSYIQGQSFVSLLIITLRPLGLVADSLNPGIRSRSILTVLITARLTISWLTGPALRLPLPIALNRLDQVSGAFRLARNKWMPEQLLCRWSLFVIVRKRRP